MADRARGFRYPNRICPVYTNHAWEDYYITLRSSRNLLEGNGLVYNAGDRLHTFTSPLGVLIPALCTWLVRSRSRTDGFVDLSRLQRDTARCDRRSSLASVTDSEARASRSVRSFRH